MGRRGGHQDKTRRTHKFQRAIVGASLNEILAKRNQKPELRNAQRDEAIRAAKESNKAKKDTKAKTAAPKDATKPKSKAPKQATKNVAKSAPRVGESDRHSDICVPIKKLCLKIAREI